MRPLTHGAEAVVPAPVVAVLFTGAAELAVPWRRRWRDLGPSIAGRLVHSQRGLFIAQTSLTCFAQRLGAALALSLSQPFLKVSHEPR